jgi:PAS domain S-box-containing protein
MNLGSLSNEQLDRNLRELKGAEHPGESDRLQQLAQELRVHEIELEMHHRALRETQAQLELSVRRFTDLYDNLPLPYVTLTETGLIVAANRAAQEWLGSEKPGLVGRNLGSFADAYDAGRLAAHLEDCLHSQAPAQIELTLRSARSEPIVVQLASRPAPREGVEAQHVHVAITDVTLLKKSQKSLQEINREQEAFNYSISHDLRAPLVTISNYAGIVMTDFGDALPEEARGMVHRIQLAAGRMEATLKHLLLYSTLSREEIVFETIDTEEVVADLLIEYRGMIQDRSAQIVVDRPLPKVRGSGAMLNQVLANLLTNALKYTEADRPPEVRFTAENRESTVVLKVIDRGIGIEPKNQERIFQIFERLHGYSRYPGSGVGLAIVRRAVDRMNGRVWVESAPGKGSCFCLELPKG